MGRPIKKSMRVLISHKSALILMRQESFRRFAVAFGKNPHFAPQEFPKLFDVAATHEVLQNLFKNRPHFRIPMKYTYCFDHGVWQGAEKIYQQLK